MRKLTLGISTALLCCGAGIAIAQVTSTMRPAPVAVSPRAMQAAAGSDVYQAQINQLTAKVTALTSQLTAANTQIAGLQNGLKATSAKTFENAGNLTNLNAQFQGHSHYFEWINDVNTGSGVKHQFVSYPTSIPVQNCTKKPTGTYNNDRFSEKYNCIVPQ
jgi:hypothetical protein